MIKNGNFQWFSAKFRVSNSNLGIHRKKLVGLKKKSWKKLVPDGFYEQISEIFFKKNRNFFQKFFF